ncbi:SAF domain-containing protein [Nocardioides daeguensis]|uniref:SAF domain-containing protein n=1 Tax=Nocardioides daeguensis TaxID=908359 RepID=A0ABP6V094_9ACTN|nr:SAF domain-containing protein [Nocardioides daeguensis]MBV6727164.1 pilus assembly protein CpaB [Nocardioides daeguensis]MCR1771178.1 pilus assembly protein CpaB [Nocardioides daeguensis]
MESRDPRQPPARPPLRRVRDALDEVRRRVLRRRRLIAALLLGLGAALAVRSLAPPPPATSTLLVAARDLPAGREVAAGDLMSVEVPADVVPQRVARNPVGRRLAAPLRTGEPVTDVRLVGPDLGAAQPAGTLTVPVRLSDAGQVALLRPGDQISLLGTDPQAGTTQVLARDTTVLAVPDPESANGGALPGRLVVLALDSVDVDLVTAASAVELVTFTWSRS